MKTQSSSIRRSGLTPGLLQRGRAAALHLAIAAATLAALPTLASPATTLDFYGSLGNLAAEADVTFKDNGQLLITLMNTGKSATTSLNDLLAGVVFTLPGDGANAPKVSTVELAGTLLGTSKSLSSSWTTSLAPTSSSLLANLDISVDGHVRAGIATQATTTSAGLTGNNHAEYSIAQGSVDFTFTFANGGMTPDEFRQDGVTVEFLFGDNSSHPNSTFWGILGDSGVTVVPPAPGAPADPLPEPSPLSLIGLAMTILLVARKRF